MTHKRFWNQRHSIVFIKHSVYDRRVLDVLTTRVCTQRTL